MRRLLPGTREGDNERLARYAARVAVILILAGAILGLAAFLM